ncbi:MAG: hypothetical protein IV100_11485 [Myxococcales bacterium]|nr:hypothetical protein [Myxococcales bacterium]
MSLTARVRSGHLVLDVPVALPEGTEVELVADDETDGLTPEDRVRLNAAIAESWQQAIEGKGRPVEDVLADLRRQR